MTNEELLFLVKFLLRKLGGRVEITQREMIEMPYPLGSDPANVVVYDTYADPLNSSKVIELREPPVVLDGTASEVRTVKMVGPGTSKGPS